MFTAFKSLHHLLRAEERAKTQNSRTTLCSLLRTKAEGVYRCGL